MQSQTIFSIKTLFLIFCFSLTTSIFADREDRNVGQFDVVHVKGFLDVFITQSNDYDVRVEAPADKINNIITVVEKGELIVSYKTKRGKNNWNWKNGKKQMKVYVSAKSLEGVHLSGSGDVEGSGITAKNFKVSISGSGDLALEVDARNIEAKIAGSGDMQLRGSTGDFNISIAGSGDIAAFGLKARSSKIKIAGSGDCEVNVSDSLDVRISGSGNIEYKGNPSNVDKSIAGSGNVDKA